MRALRHIRRWIGVVALGTSLLSGCGDDLTEIVLSIDTDLAVPDELDSVRLVVTGPSGDTALDSTVSLDREGAPSLPLTHGLTPGGSSLGPVTVEVTGTGSDGLRLTRTAVTSFVKGERRLLRLDLLRECLGVSCGDGMTCVEGSCRGEMVAKDDLAPWPGEPPDPLPTSDAGMEMPDLVCMSDGDCSGGAPCLARRCHESVWPAHAIGAQDMCTVFEAGAGAGEVHCLGSGGGSYLRVTGIAEVSELNAGAGHVCAKRGGGEVHCFGENTDGQLGDPSFTEDDSVFEPRETPITDASSICAGGNHSCALLRNGTVSCWGANDSGQLGDGTSTGRAMPMLVESLSDAMQITCGTGFTCALRETGAVQCWGANDMGQLGNGTTDPAMTPTAVSDISGVEQVVAGRTHACARDGSGAVFCWGAGAEGQLGDGTTAAMSNTPVETGSLDTPVELTAGDDHTCARTDGNEVHCWGANDMGQLFASGVDRRVLPTRIGMGAEGVWAGGRTTCVWLADGPQCEGELAF